MNKDLTPRQIVEELNKYIVGQQDAKKNVAIALRNRWRRMQATEEIRNDIIPNNILMIGSTGVGKTEIARRLAKIAHAPFTKVEASKFTEVGYVGRDVESMVRDLVEQAVNMVKQDRKERVKARAEAAVEDLLLDALLPPVAPGRTENGNMQEVDPMYQQTRELFKQKLRNGELEDRKIEINVAQSGSGNVGIMGGAGMIDESSLIQLQEMLGNMMPKKQKKRKLSITEARKVLLEEETAKLIDMDEVKEEALFLAEQNGIIFIDEIDKIATGQKGGGPDVSREGVQRDLLPVVEGSAVNTKYGIVHTDHVLFIAAGAFHVSKPSDLIPELQGRFPIRVELSSLSREDFRKILKEPKNALTRQYQAMFEAEGVSLVFEDLALERIAEIAWEVNAEHENIGARRLQTVMSKLLNDFLFDMPENLQPGTNIVITPELVDDRLQHLLKNKDLSRYIL